MSRPIHEVKPLQARLVRSWETRLEVRVLSVLCNAMASCCSSHVVQVVRIVGFHPIDPGSSPGVGVEISVSVCRRGLVGYDAAFTLLRSWVRIPPFVLHATRQEVCLLE